MQVNEYLIETRGLSRRFGTQIAVDDLNLLVPAEGVYGFLDQTAPVKRPQSECCLV